MVKTWLPFVAEIDDRFNVVSASGDRFSGNTVVTGAAASRDTDKVTDDIGSLPLLRTMAWSAVLLTKKLLRSCVPRGEMSTRKASLTGDGAIPPSVVSNPGRYRLIQPSTLFLMPSENMNMARSSK